MISLVSTVFNDRAGAELFFRRMAAQTRLPDEIVIVDSFSRDGTWDVLGAELARADRPWRLVAWQERCNVARGRNLAIARAAGPLIVSTDLGCDWDPEWLEELAAPLLARPEIGVVIGSWEIPEAWATTPWAKTEYAFLPSHKLEAKPESQGTSRSIAYRKSVWEQIGGYPEDLTLAADDTCFDALLKKHRVPSAGAPVVRCYWHRHETLRGFLKEQYRYFLGDGEAAFHLRHFVLVGGRLAMEFLGLPGGMALLATGRPLVGTVCLTVSVASVALRQRRVVRAIPRLRAKGVDHPWCRLTVFEYLTKIYGIFAFARGYLRGFKHCRTIRRRLREPMGTGA